MLFQLPLVPTAIYSNSNVISTAMHSLVVSAALNWPVSTSGGSQAASYHAMQPASVAKQQRQHVMWTQVAAAAAAGTDARQQHGRLVAAPAARPSAVVKAAAAEPQEDEGMEEEWVEVGRIGPPHGVRGEMKVQPLTDFPEDRLGEPGPRWVHGCTVGHVHYLHHDMYIVRGPAAFAICHQTVFPGVALWSCNPVHWKHCRACCTAASRRA